MKALKSQCIVGLYDFEINREVESFLKEYPVGGLALFNSPWDSADNIWKDEDASLEAIFEMQQKLGPKGLFLSVDQEGGRVRRLRGSYVNLPAAQSCANYFEETKDEAGLKKLYSAAAQQLRLSGIALNFAPVIDRLYPESSSVVGDRSFGSDLNIIKKLASLFLSSFREEGVATALKHFPGHGASAYDSHEKTATLFLPKEEVQEDEKIFEDLAPLADGIMTAHVAYAETPDVILSLDQELVRSAMERFQKIRPELFWITDDLLQMKAVSDQAPVEQAWQIGYDHLLLCGPLDRAANAIDQTIRFVEAQKLSFEEQQKAQARAQRARERFSKVTAPDLNFKDWKSKIKSLTDEVTPVLQKIAEYEKTA